MAGETLYGLSLSDVMRLKRVLTLVESGGNLPRYPMPRNILPGAGVVVGLLTNAVSATTALTSTPKVGTESLNVYTFSSTGVVDTGEDETVYNFAPQAATTDRWTFCYRDSLTGKLIIGFQACS